MEDTALSTSPDGSIPIANGKIIKKHPVIEIFGPVIQGEGSQAGQQTMFVRFGGCDYRCEKCDSLHAVIPEAIQKYGTMMEPMEIFERLQEARDKTGVQWVTFSGGNPCMHKLNILVSLLINNDWFINVETQGTLWQDWLYACTVITVSPKTSGMGEKFEEAKFRKFLQHLNGTRPLCLKVVVFSEADLEDALFYQQVTQQEAQNWLYSGRENIAYYLSLGNPYPPVLDEDLNLQTNPELIQVTDESEDYNSALARHLLNSYRRFSEEVLQDRRLKDFRFLPQLHVLVYGNETRR